MVLASECCVGFALYRQSGSFCLEVLFRFSLDIVVIPYLAWDENVGRSQVIAHKCFCALACGGYEIRSKQQLNQQKP